jgi:hypothetical protein
MAKKAASTSAKKVKIGDLLPSLFCKLGSSRA